MDLSEKLLEFFIRGLEMLGLGPEPDPFEMGFWQVFENKFSQNWGSFTYQENSVCTSF
jgi:hypothetical protein